jgi:phage terminase large subunit-like protein
VVIGNGHDRDSETYCKSECRPLGLLRRLHRKTQKNRDHNLTFIEWLELRDRARKDLYWLGHDCIGTPESGSGFVEHVHREMLDCFVRKNFDKVYHRGWTLDEARAAIDRQPRVKEMLQLCPTGSFKSTANKVDAVQWMLNMPDIRIFIITGSGPLSRKFLKEVKGFFFKPIGKALTHFQGLFPEYVIEGEDGESLTPMTSPARIHEQPGTPTLWVNSIDGAIAGWHCDIWKGDDVVNEQNSNTEETRLSLKEKYDNISQNRPDMWAFRDHLGTRYYPDDWYGSRIDEWKKYPDTNALKYLCRAAWKVKPAYEAVPIKQLQEHMVDLYFPEFMPFAVLMKKCRQNEKQFRCQQLNEPAGGDVACHFDEESIKSHTILLSGVPRIEGIARRPVIVWDTAHGDKVQSDYSAGAVGWCHRETRTLYVLEVRSGKWKDSQTAVQLVELHWKWEALFSEVEKFHGWELFAAEVQRVSYLRYRKQVPLLWGEPDTTGGAKRNRIKGLETLLAADRLYFVDGDWMELLTQQFTRFTGFSKRRKDDIPDAVSGLQRLIPAETPFVEVANAQEGDRKAREARELRDRFWQQHKEAEYGTIFQAPPAATPKPATETSAKIDSGPGRVFGDTVCIYELPDRFI